MAKQSKPQKETVERVMHEFKHGELASSSGRKVKNPKQAIAIALSEAGSSKNKSKAENNKSLAKTKARERKGETARDVDEAPKTKGAAGRAKGSAGEKTRADLYEEAKRKDIPGRSTMNKDQLARALKG